MTAALADSAEHDGRPRQELAARPAAARPRGRPDGRSAAAAAQSRRRPAAPPQRRRQRTARAIRRCARARAPPAPRGPSRRERAHHDAHGAPSPLGRDDVGDDRQRESCGRTAECAGEHARRHHGGQADRKPAGEVPSTRPPSATASAFRRSNRSRNERAQHAGGRCCRRVAAPDDAKARQRDAEPGREVRPERHHHHEVQHVDELDCRDEEDDAALGNCRGSSGLGAVNASAADAATQWTCN